MNELPQKVQDALDTLKAKSHSESGDFCAPINFYSEDSDYREAVNTIERAIRQKSMDEQRECIAAAAVTGYKCPICRHYKLCHTPMFIPKCGGRYTHFEPKED